MTVELGAAWDEIRPFRDIRPVRKKGAGPVGCPTVPSVKPIRSVRTDRLANGNPERYPVHIVNAAICEIPRQLTDQEPAEPAFRH